MEMEGVCNDEDEDNMDDLTDYEDQSALQCMYRSRDQCYIMH
jgi:hypothetical protein